MTINKNIDKKLQLEDEFEKTHSIKKITNKSNNESDE